MVGLESLSQGRDLGLGLLESHPGFEPREPFDPASTAIVELVAPWIERRLHRRRYPELHRVSDERSKKSVWCDADDHVRHAVVCLRLADDRRIAAEAFLPFAIADHGDGMRVLSGALVGREAAAKNWPD